MVSKNMDGLNLSSRTPLTSPTTKTASLSSPATPNGMNEYRRIIGGSATTPVTSPTGSVSGTPTTTACTGDSRIPRPSPTGLRRSSSMRLRGERGYHSNFRATGSSPASSSIPIQQYHQRHNSHSIHCQNELFPAITENGVDSPRHRTLVSLIFFNIIN